MERIDWGGPAMKQRKKVYQAKIWKRLVTLDYFLNHRALCLLGTTKHLLYYNSRNISVPLNSFNEKVISFSGHCFHLWI